MGVEKCNCYILSPGIFMTARMMSTGLSKSWVGATVKQTLVTECNLEQFQMGIHAPAPEGGHREQRSPLDQCRVFNLLSR